MNLRDFETMCRNADLLPVRRGSHRNGEYFIADGFVSADHLGKFQRFHVKESEFPQGCYVAMWGVADGEDVFRAGGPLFFEPLHDIDKIPLSDRKRARANAAEAQAIHFLDKRNDKSE